MAALQSSGPRVFGTFPFDLTVAQTGQDLQANASAAAALLPSSGKDGAIRTQIQQALASVAARPIHSRTDIEANLKDLLGAAAQASSLRTVDPTAVRLALDELIRYWEARWSVF